MIQECQDDNKPSLGNSLGILQRITRVMNYSQQAMKQTNATLCYDATGGGALSAQVLEAFDKAGQTLWS